MGEVFVLAEHRQGKIRDITHEMLAAGEKIASQQGTSSTAVLFGHNVKNYVEELATRAAKVLVVEDRQLEHFNSIPYQKSPLLSHCKISTPSYPDRTHRF